MSHSLFSLFQSELQSDPFWSADVLTLDELLVCDKQNNRLAIF